MTAGSTRQVHVCICKPDRHLRAHPTRIVLNKKHFGWWNITKSARPGDRVIFYAVEPTSAFVATALVKDAPVRCPDPQSPWKDDPCALLSHLKPLQRALTLAQAKASLPGWSYLNRPGRTCLPNDTTPPDVVRRFLKLLRTVAHRSKNTGAKAAVETDAFGSRKGSGAWHANQFILRGQPFTAAELAKHTRRGAVPSHLQSLRRKGLIKPIGNRRWLMTGVLSTASFAEEITDAHALIEGAACRVTINAYERNPQARQQCIAHYGTSCSVCEASLDSVYGPAAERLIHVHHLRALSDLAREYIVDPIRDLRPVCPNCHAVLHRRSPSPYTIKEVQAFLQSMRQKNSV